MAVRIRATAEQLRRSLFFVPMMFVIGGLALGLVSVEVDRQLVEAPGALPFVLTSTVDSARSVLGTVASATITVAGIAFSVSLLVIQLASSQHSPRIVHGLLRDPFSRRIMGVVAGTFTYCLVVLRAVRGPLEEGGTAVVPNLSVAIAVLLGVGSILAIVAFIDHSAHSMDVSRMLSRASSDGIATGLRLWSDEGRAPTAGPVGEPTADHVTICHDRSGWIQQLDFDALIEAAPPEGTVRLLCEVGDFAVVGTPLCQIWPTPPDTEDARRRSVAALVIGQSRTSEQDVTYAVRQLADVALRALSPGVNDPTTAQDAIFHLGAVLAELLPRRPPPLVAPMRGSRSLIRPERRTASEVIAMAFDEVRMACRDSPTVAIYLLDTLHRLDQRAGGDAEIGEALAEQARLIRDGADRADLLPPDRARLAQAHERLFAAGRDRPGAGPWRELRPDEHDS